jgi:hypothetical protein
VRKYARQQQQGDYPIPSPAAYRGRIIKIALFRATPTDKEIFIWKQIIHNAASRCEEWGETAGRNKLRCFGNIGFAGKD